MLYVCLCRCVTSLGIRGYEGRHVPPFPSPSVVLIITHSHAVNITLQVVTLMRGAPFQTEEAHHNRGLYV